MFLLKFVSPQRDVLICKGGMRTLFLCLLISFFAPHALLAQSYEEWVHRAASHIESDKFDSAAVALQRAMTLDPANENNPVLLLNLGVIQRELGQYDDAYISFTAAMPNNPMTKVVLHCRASLLSEMNRFDESIEDYSSIIRQFPDDVEAYYRRGVLFLEKSNRRKGEADFVKAHEIDPEHFYTQLSRALLYKLEDDWEAAEKIYSRLIDEEPNPDPSILLNRAECYVHMGQMFRAVGRFAHCGTSSKGESYFYFLRGRVRLEQFDKMAARADFEQAKEMGV